MEHAPAALGVSLASESGSMTPATAMVIRLEELRWVHRDESGEPVSGPPLVPGQEQLFS